nr:LysR family transcriptional regulator [Rhizobium indigoferae]
MAAVADALGISSSAVSQQIAQLEDEVGIPLVERRGRGVMLTRPARGSSCMPTGYSPSSRKPKPILPSCRKSSPAT